MLLCIKQPYASVHGTTEDEMVGWHHRLNGREFEQTPGVGDGQGSLACCSPRGRKESDTTEQPIHPLPPSLILPGDDLPLSFPCNFCLL